MQFSGSTIQIDQSKEPTEITLLGTAGAVSLAQSMVEVRTLLHHRPPAKYLHPPPGRHVSVNGAASNSPDIITDA